MSSPLLKYISTQKQDGVIYKAAHLISEAGDDMFRLDEAIDAISDMLSCFNSELLLERYTKDIAKMACIKPVILLKKVKGVTEDKKQDFQVVPEGKKALAKWIDKDKFFTIGYDMRVDLVDKHNTGIYFAASNHEARQLTNFTVRPLIHVISQDDNNRRLTEIDSGWSKVIIQMPSKAWASVDMFESITMDQGSFFLLDGFTKSHLNKLKSSMLPAYPKCFELNTLGWQPEGFFAFSNLIVKENTINFDEYGVATVDDVNYLSMGASSALNQIRLEDDIYKNDRYLKYIHTDLTFSQWTTRMVDVYGDNGMMGVSWALIAAFKDIIFKRNNNCPVPYAYGAVQSGKSKFVESVCNLFTVDMPAFNLNQGTDFAFFERMERFRNVPMAFNEFDEMAIKEEWFRAIKGAFDGEGRAKGSGRRNKTKTQDINCLPVLLGQFLSTKDDGSVLQRSIPVKFVENNNRTPEETKKYNELKDYEKKGITSILCEILRQRRYVIDNYLSRFEEIGTRLRNTLAAANVVGKNRIVENYTNAMVVVSLINDKISLGFDFDKFFNFCIGEIVTLSSVIAESNALSEFWKLLEFMLDQDLIEQGYHYKIEAHSEVRIATDRSNTTNRKFEEPKRLLFLRFNTVHAIYMGEKRKQTGKNGLNAETILTYMRDQNNYIGNNPGSTFRDKHGKSTNTSSFVFDYDKLGINLDRFIEKDPIGTLTTIEGQISMDGIVKDIIGTMKIYFTLFQDESYEKDGVHVENKHQVRCYWTAIDKITTVKSGRKVKVTGLFHTHKTKDSEFRSMQVQEIAWAETPNDDLPF